MWDEDNKFGYDISEVLRNSWAGQQANSWLNAGSGYEPPEINVPKIDMPEIEIAKPGTSNFATTMGGFGDMAKGVGSLAQAWAALKGIGLAEDQFEFGKEAWNANYLAQAKTLNQRSEGMAHARHSGADQNNNPYRSSSEHMAKWGVSENKVG